ncbi:jg10635 [Pararge aegeria aegeria]|uniref:Jg10635 protein n=1 Tax=Pararge aegeria aegeria TaxID=348720 RepID=A0A8S4RD41_9NEOP|nr:jg10635 [Pararge aegeria aegeria]
MTIASNAKLCTGCKNDLPKKEYLSCSTCGSNKRPKKGNTNTPVRAAVASLASSKEVSEPTDLNVTVRRKPSKSPTPTLSNTEAVGVGQSESNRSSYLTESNLRDILKQKLSSTIAKLVTAQLNTINLQITGFGESMSFINAQFEEMKAVMAEKSAIINQLNKENDQLRSSVKDLTNRLNIVESHLRECNIEVNGIPEHRSENLVNTMLQLGQVVKNPLINGRHSACYSSC